MFDVSIDEKISKNLEKMFFLNPKVMYTEMKVFKRRTRDELHFDNLLYIEWWI